MSGSDWEARTDDKAQWQPASVIGDLDDARLGTRPGPLPQPAAYFRKSAVQVEIPALRGERLTANYVSAARLRRLIAPSPDAPARNIWSHPVRLDHPTH